MGYYAKDVQVNNYYFNLEGNNVKIRATSLEEAEEMIKESMDVIGVTDYYCELLKTEKYKENENII